MRKQIAFASLTDVEIQQIADSLVHETYDAVLTRINQPRSEGGYGLDISRSPLERLWAKHAKLKKINAYISSGEKLSMARLEEIEAGDAPASGEVHDAIMTATYKQAISGENTPHQLLALQRLADFPVRAELREQAAAIRAERMQITRAKEQRAQAKAQREAEMHTHKITLDLRKFEHKLDMDTFHKHIATARLELAQRSHTLREQLAHSRLTPNLNPNLFPSPHDTNTSLSTRNPQLSTNPNLQDEPSESNPTQHFEFFGPSPLPPEVMEENARYAELLLAGKIETHYKRDPENSLFAKICALTSNLAMNHAHLDSQSEQLSADNTIEVSGTQSDHSPRNAELHSAVSPNGNRQPSATPASATSIHYRLETRNQKLETNSSPSAPFASPLLAEPSPSANTTNNQPQNQITNQTT
jgi:hypothetical protein